MRPHCPLVVVILTLLLALAGCQNITAVSSDPELTLFNHVNATANQQGSPCLNDYCLDEWPEPSDLDQLEYWDCKAYAVAKADRLIHQHGYHPARLEYVLISGPPLRVTHTALLVDGRWILDSGLRCSQVCNLEQFAAGVQIDGRLPVSELRYVRQALRVVR